MKSVRIAFRHNHCLWQPSVRNLLSGLTAKITGNHLIKLVAFRILEFVENARHTPRRLGYAQPQPDSLSATLQEMDRPLMRSMYRSALLALLLAGAANTRAEVILCTEVVPPATITQPGVYCLLKSHVVSNASPAIAIRANNVVLDLNGHRIGKGNQYNANDSPTTAIEVENAQNVTIRNGTIRGFSTGIRLTGSSSQNHLVEDMLIDGVSGFGINSWSSNGSVFRRNRIYGQNLQTLAGGVTGTGGIYAVGDGVNIQSNVVQNFPGTQYLTGIYASGRVLIENNYISGFFTTESSSPMPVTIIGIYCTGESVVSGNKVMNISSTQAWTTVIGIQADEHTKLTGNIVSAVTGVSYGGGVQIPGTNY